MTLVWDIDRWLLEMCRERISHSPIIINFIGKKKNHKFQSRRVSFEEEKKAKWCNFTSYVFTSKVQTPLQARYVTWHQVSTLDTPLIETDIH